jgi:hypothetical protein
MHARRGPALKGRTRWLLWLNAVLWSLFALGMVAVALTSEEARAHPVFVQVLAACIAAAIGAVAAARYQAWGAVLTLVGGAGVLLAWIAGESGNPYRWFVAADLAVFLACIGIDREAFRLSPAPL